MQRIGHFPVAGRAVSAHLQSSLSKRHITVISFDDICKYSRSVASGGCMIAATYFAARGILAFDLQSQTQHTVISGACYFAALSGEIVDIEDNDGIVITGQLLLPATIGLIPLCSAKAFGEVLATNPGGIASCSQFAFSTLALYKTAAACEKNQNDIT